MAFRIILVTVLVTLAVVTRASPTRSGCSLKGKNYDEGEEVQDGCFFFKCLNGFMSFQYGECMTADGNCLAVGEEHTNGCSRVKCVVEKDANGYSVYKFKTLEQKCNIDGKCFEPGQTYRCLKCLADGNIERKCSFNGECYDHGVQMEINCYQQTCNTEGSIIGFQIDAAQGKKCNYFGTCLNAGEKYDACTSCREDGTLDSVEGCAYKSSEGVEECVGNGGEGIDFFYGEDMKCTCTIDAHTIHSNCNSLK